MIAFAGEPQGPENSPKEQPKERDAGEPGISELEQRYQQLAHDVVTHMQVLPKSPFADNAKKAFKEFQEQHSERIGQMNLEKSQLGQQAMDIIQKAERAAADTPKKADVTDAKLYQARYVFTFRGGDWPKLIVNGKEIPLKGDSVELENQVLVTHTPESGTEPIYYDVNIHRKFEGKISLQMNARTYEIADIQRDIVEKTQERLEEVIGKFERTARQHDRDNRVAERLRRDVEYKLLLAKAEKGGGEPERMCKEANQLIDDAEKMLNTEEGWEKKKWNEGTQKLTDQWATMESGKPGFVYKKIDHKIYAYCPALGADSLQVLTDGKTLEWSFVTGKEEQKTIIGEAKEADTQKLQQQIEGREADRLKEIYGKTLEAALRQKLEKSMRGADLQPSPIGTIQLNFSARNNQAIITCTVETPSAGLKSFPITFALPGKNGAPADYPPPQEIVARIANEYQTDTPLIDADQQAKLGTLRRSEGLMAAEGAGARSTMSFNIGQDRLAYLSPDGTKLGARYIDPSGERWKLVEKKNEAKPLMPSIFSELEETARTAEDIAKESKDMNATEMKEMLKKSTAQLERSKIVVEKSFRMIEELPLTPDRKAFLLSLTKRVIQGAIKISTSLIDRKIATNDADKRIAENYRKLFEELDERCRRKMQ